ncbi:MAG TPA: TadE/TadG family type IV pilus assembly protein [Candidatus Dormibacteraeota bacterium]|nr:TadE/TadG family type IV pilus assembly protein [Candidatus Dormibacteraeota bacterium]
MRASESAQALVEWALSAFVLMLFALGTIAVGQIVGEDMAVREAASEAALAAARAPSAQAAQVAGQDAAKQAAQGSQLQDLEVTIDTAGFQRGGTLIVTVHAYVSLAAFPIVSEILGRRVPLTWQSRALIEPFRSRTP